MRVVIDTNILVSFAIRPNRYFEIIFDHIAAQGTLLVSEATIAELFGVLRREKFRKYIPLEQAADYVEWYMSIAELVAVTESIVACRDPQDDKFLSLAVSGKANYIIAGDNDLPVLGSIRGIPIYAPRIFIREVIAAGG